VAHAHRTFYSLAHVVHLVASAAMFAVGATARLAAAAMDAFVSLVLSTAPPQPVLAMVTARAPQTMGLHQTRAFTARRLWRDTDRRSRAPDSVAFVTA
jgi:hypothetical protein